MREYSPLELRTRLEAGGRRLVLVDVREPWEFELCRVAESINVPLETLPARAAELPRDAELVMICHHGMRSRHAGAYLQRAGFQEIANLDGGIDAWAVSVDRDMARY